MPKVRGFKQGKFSLSPRLISGALNHDSSRLRTEFNSEFWLLTPEFFFGKYAAKTHVEILMLRLQIPNFNHLIFTSTNKHLSIPANSQCTHLPPISSNSQNFSLS